MTPDMTAQDELDTFPSRIQNWVRWARTKPHYQHCMSIEHRYRPPPCWGGQNPKIEIDILDAVIIERCVVRLPDKYKTAMKYAHVLPWIQFGVQLRKIDCKERDYNEIVRKAETMLKNILHRYKNNANVNENLNPSLDE